MGTRVEYPVGRARGTAYLSTPRKGSGLLVIHAWWGLNRFFQTLCDRFAAEGFVTLAPDLYHGSIAATVDDAKKLRSTLKAALVRNELSAALDYLKAQPQVEGQAAGLVGFSLGAYWASWLACERANDIAATVIFYGARKEDYRRASGPFQGHFAERDPYISDATRKEFERRLRAAGRDAEIHVYPGTSHWFFEEDRADAYDARSAGVAWRRTIGFLRARLALSE